jgi:hypothetical protein
MNVGVPLTILHYWEVVRVLASIRLGEWGGILSSRISVRGDDWNKRSKSNVGRSVIGIYFGDI